VNKHCNLQYELKVNGDNLTENVIGAEWTFLDFSMSRNRRTVSIFDRRNIIHSILFCIAGDVLVATDRFVGARILD
jgi:hypothetical protein